MTLLVCVAVTSVPYLAATATTPLNEERYLLHRSRPLNNPFDNCCAFGDLVEKRGLIQKQPQQATTRRASHKAKEARIYAGISMVN